MTAEAEMEYRGWVTISWRGGLTQDDELEILRQLDRHHEELGPVGLSPFVVSTDEHEDPLEAAQELITAVIDAASMAGFPDVRLEHFELEAVDERKPVGC